MKGRNSQSRKLRNSRKQGRRSSRLKGKTKAAKTRRSQRLSEMTSHQYEQRERCFKALRLYREGKVKSLTAAARRARTTVGTIRQTVPAALIQKGPGARIRVKAADPYSMRVKILSRSEGAITTTARGSRERELAGRHRATVKRVLGDKESPSALKQYRGKTVGGRELISDYDELSSFANAGALGQLDTLYVSPDIAA